VSGGESTPPPIVARANLVLVLAFAWLFVTPLCLFWGAVWGLTRVSSQPATALAPNGLSFLAGLALSFTPCVLPKAYYRGWEGPGGARLFETLGVRAFKRIATNGDLVNRWGRRRAARHRIVRDLGSAREWARQAQGAERNHLVFLSMGLLSAAYAVSIGWSGWALGLTVSNVVFNAYPIALQRYNRLRIGRLAR
jgi:hypothetical protein